MGARVLFGVLNWGLGHAARSIPVIRGYMAQGFEPVIASDGLALDFLKQHFPDLTFEPLPMPEIRYGSRSRWLSLQVAGTALQHFPLMLSRRRYMNRLLERYKPQVIFSDNCPFFRHPDVRSIYMTHQLQVPAGKMEGFAGFLHRKVMMKFDEIQVPDFATPPGLSGRLGHPENKNRKIKYTGPVTRFTMEGPQRESDWLLLLSGPEKQRTVLEKLLIEHQSLFDGSVVLVRGTNRVQRLNYPAHWQVYDLLPDGALGALIRGAKKIVSRSGYTSVMDWYLLGKKAILVPTPGQGEQEYLAAHLEAMHWFPAVDQNRLEKIAAIAWHKYYRFQPQNAVNV